MTRKQDMNKHVIQQGRGNARQQGGFHRKLLPVLIAACFGAGQVQANPLGAQVVNGQVSIASQGNVLTVTNSPGAIINWQSFSIGAGELTRFVQQGASSTVLNRIVGQDPSRILGALQSNGRVFLINPNGILFGQGAQVNVAGLVASTLNISNEDFLAGRMKFQAGDKAAGLQNQGSIATPGGGQIYLIAPNVENSGILTSPKGEVVLAAGHSVHLVDGANPDLHVVVSAPDNQALNLGQVVAEGGKIGIYGALVKQRGLVSANSAVVGENGKIVFKASKDALLEAGSRTTATGAGSGGTVHVLGERVGLSGDAKIDVSGQTGGGTVLVGGDYQGKNADVMNARQVYFGQDAEVRADALDNGDGGKVILWADETTRAYGSISARGGQQGGNGGFVETSGKQNLDFNASIDTSAPKGQAGMALLDPDTLTIVASGGANDDQVSTIDGNIFATEGVGSSYSVSESALENIASTTNVWLQASGQITVDTLFDGILSFQQGPGGQVKIESTTSGGIRFQTPTDILRTNGASVELRAGGSGSLDIGKIHTNGGAVTMNAAGTLATGEIVSTNGSTAGNISLMSGGLMTLGINGGINANAPASGNITLNANGAIHMQNGYMISGNQLHMTANGGINDGNPTPGSIATEVNSIQLQNSGAGDIHIWNTSAALAIDNLDGTGNGIRQQSGGQNIYIDTIGSLTVNAPVTTDNGNIELWAGAGALNNYTNIAASNGYVNLSASNGNIFNAIPAAIVAGNGDAYLSSGGIIDNMGNITANGGSTVLDAATGINQSGQISNAGGYVELYAYSPDALISTAPGSQIINNGGAIELIADRMALSGTVNAGTIGHVVLTPYSSDHGIHVGTGATDGMLATLELSVSELNQVRAGHLVIGDGSNGPIDIKAPLFGGTSGALEFITSGLVLQSSGTISQQAGAIIAGGSSVAAYGSEVNLMESNSTGVIAGEAFAGDFQYRSTNQITLQNVWGYGGIYVPADKSIRLVSDMGINQALGSPVDGGHLVLQTPGSVYLDYSGNYVSKLSADLYVGGTGTGSFAMVNGTDLVVDSSATYGISGVNTNNRSVEIAVMPGYTVTQNAPINAGSASVSTHSLGYLTGGSSTTFATTTTTSVMATTSTTGTTTSTSAMATTSTGATTTTTGSVTTTTMPQTVAQDPEMNNAVTQSSTNTIVSTSTEVAPQVGGSTQNDQQEDDDAPRSSDAITREEQTGASKNEVAQKLYCN